MKFLVFSQTKLGSSFDIMRARVGGASVIPLLSSLLFSVPPSRRKVLGAKPKQAGKKKSGVRKMKRAKSIFLWCCEVSEQWRGWLTYWGFSSKKVQTSIKKHRQFSLFVKS